VWNEPNIELFLAPQFDEQGRSVAPQTYAAMYRAAHDGIEAANPDALVAIGETSSHGKDEPSEGFMQDRHSPARFAELLAQADPELEFDAWAHHPYPVRTGTQPDGLARWPNVTLPSLDRLGQSLDRWFGREDVPIWITELGYEVAPAEPKGVSADTHAEYAAQSLEIAASVERVAMFVWFAFADSEANAWESGLLDETGVERPAFAAFTAAVREQAR
jgi:Glycosyl hydrolase catalytic core